MARGGEKKRGDEKIIEGERLGLNLKRRKKKRLVQRLITARARQRAKKTPPEHFRKESGGGEGIRIGKRHTERTSQTVSIKVAGWGSFGMRVGGNRRGSRVGKKKK